MNPLEPENLERLNQVAGAFSRSFSGPDGELALNHLRERFFVSDTTLAVDSSGRLDPALTAAHEGQRSVVLYILDLVNFNLSAADTVLASLRQPVPAPKPERRQYAKRSRK
jgi:hypothetical protein